jgi:hypothetical protein
MLLIDTELRGISSPGKITSPSAKHIGDQNMPNPRVNTMKMDQRSAHLLQDGRGVRADS